MQAMLTFRDDLAFAFLRCHEIPLGFPTYRLNSMVQETVNDQPSSYCSHRLKTCYACALRYIICYCFAVDFNSLICDHMRKFRKSGNAANSPTKDVSNYRVSNSNTNQKFTYNIKQITYFTKHKFNMMSSLHNANLVCVQCKMT